MPDATEMFITSSNTDGIIYGNPQLEPEYGLNLDAGIRGKQGSFYFDCSLFSNFFTISFHWNIGSIHKKKVQTTVILISTGHTLLERNIYRS